SAPPVLLAVAPCGRPTTDHPCDRCRRPFWRQGWPRATAPFGHPATSRPCGHRAIIDRARRLAATGRACRLATTNRAHGRLLPMRATAYKHPAVPLQGALATTGCPYSRPSLGWPPLQGVWPWSTIPTRGLAMAGRPLSLCSL
ncbi:hypothetical protein B296_00057970, partial [Ensete ventricosum]